MNAAQRKQLSGIISTIEDAKGKLADIQGEEQDKWDNMPENLQGSEKGEALQTAIDQIETARHPSRLLGGHPERLPGEIYMGNTDENAFFRSSWMSKRMGVRVLDSNGESFNAATIAGQLHPWFIARSEVEQTIKTEELANHSWSANKIKALRELLADTWNPHGTDVPS
jgi:hypothetical protein